MKMLKVLLSVALCVILPGCTWLLGPPATYTVTYDGNDNNAGTVPVDTKVYEEGETVTVLGNTGNLGIDGGVFSGWNTKADGTGTGYDTGATFTMGNSNVVLYAEYSGQGAAVLNFTDGGKLFSNLIAGTAISDEAAIDSVECALDGGAYNDAVGTADWSFALPSGTPAWKTGTVHTISVRVTDTGGRSSVSDFSFTRGPYRDFNADGYRDLFITAPLESDQQGRVFVLFGDENGPPARDIAADGADITITSSGTGVLQLGYGLVIGDFNGDGYADIAATENGYNTNTGAAYIIHGGPGWSAQTIAVDNAADTTITGEETYDYFGYHAGCGDLDSDGIDDLFVSAHYYGSPPVVQGRTYAFYGGAGGIADTNLGSTTADFSITGENDYDEFGGSPFTADFNGDGNSDLYIAAVGYYGGALPSLYRGRGYIFHGTGSVFSSFDLSADDTADTIITGSADGDKLANARAGDLDGDGFDDLIVKESGVPDSRGINYIFYGGESGIPTTDLSDPAASADATIMGEAADDSIGVAAVGDVDGDSFIDLVCSSSSADSGAGEVYIFSGGPSRFSGELSVSSANVVIAGGADDHLSWRLVDDLNADGFDDLVIGTSYSLTDVDTPELRIVFGDASGIPALNFATDPADVVITGTAPGSYFGWKVF